MKTEMQLLNNISNDSLYCAGANFSTIEYSYKIFQRHFVGESILEMGPAEGVMTDLLVKTNLSLTVVEGAEIFCKNLAERHPNIGVVHSLFEDFEPKSGFDNIVLGHVLEHVENPADILSRAKKWLNPGGKIMAAVPNCRSLHRQAAVIMGMLPTETSLNEMDLHHGHRRVFSPETFRSCFKEAGLNVDIFGGYWLKPVSNGQIEEHWTDEMLNAFMILGERYPDISGEIYIIASN